MFKRVRKLQILESYPLSILFTISNIAKTKYGLILKHIIYLQ
jgi:hypothetical protein